MDELLKNEERVNYRHHNCDKKGTIREMKQVNGNWLCQKHANYFGDREEDDNDE